MHGISLRRPDFLTALNACQYENKRCQRIMVKEEERDVHVRSLRAVGGSVGSSNGARKVAVSFLSTSCVLSQLLPSSQACNSVPLKVGRAALRMEAVSLEDIVIKNIRVLSRPTRFKAQRSVFI
ncbi:hypothetical protein Q8A67_019059 [Cirrhinus molitorella]|uniref:Uncharacterized protein n=1 Tax=Cirrhinus molitorella TaxID=172907 RepID=A0AA88P939_9TELE|nr:hypothetical protein Q8A67_019059 [Cirrhinus molitorella]